MHFKKLNNFFGWLVFALSYVVYLKTMEPTVSFWDCGEFLSVAYKLQVGHSPGAPLFMMLGRIWSLFAPAPDKVALLVNSLSALMSGLTIMFLFWTITYFGRKIACAKGDTPTGATSYGILGAGLVGALAYTFSDTFWFSAVEAEVYASSSFFTAIVFWAILKWEEHADEPRSDRWLILISYLMGLSTGVHLLNLLTIPALTMVYYFKRSSNINVRGSIIAFVTGCILLAIVQFGIIQGLPYLASRLELLFVNGFKLPFDSGAIFFLFVLVLIFSYLLFWSKRAGKYFTNLATLCILFVIIGYSSYISTLLRAKAQVSINMTHPDNMMSLVSYLARDQYGQQPVFTGPYYNSQPDDLIQGKNIYKPVQSEDGNDHYEMVGHDQPSYHYPSDQTHFFPRIWSGNLPSHINFYENYLGLGKDGDPTSNDNYRFFFKYQTNWMWWRYLMWNYAGRENDYQGSGYGESQNGNWISGLPAVDKSFGRGNLDELPESYKINRATNRLYLLPFLLGVAGIVYQIRKGRLNAIVVGLLFFFTGWAIVIYLNNTPLQPRERDYAYAGATYAYAIWIGLGVMQVAEWLQRIVKNAVTASCATTAISLLAVPVLMAASEWDDHDRSRKTLARTTAYNTLMSCDSNAILFTFGDNDTYPLWYLQEVEGIRTDVRIINTSLLGIDWYIDELRYKTNNADAVPMIWKPAAYQADKNNYLRYQQNPQLNGRFANLEQVLAFIFSDNPANQVNTQMGTVNILPTTTFSIPVDKQAIIRQQSVPVQDTGHIVPEITFKTGENLNKSDLGMLNIIAAIAREGWKRPVYFSAGFPGGGDYQGLDAYIMAEGVVNKLVPLKQDNSGPGIGQPQQVNLDKSVALFTKTYLWGGGNRNDIYFDEKNKVMMETYRVTAAKVANALITSGRKQEALQVLNAVYSGVSYAANPYNQLATTMSDAYYRAGDTSHAHSINDRLFTDNMQMIKYMMALKEDPKQLSLTITARNSLGILQMVSQMAQQYGDKAKADNYTKGFNSSYQAVMDATGGNLGQ